MPPLGDLLRQRREEFGWTLEEVSQRTRIRRNYLQALEEGKYDLLPADVHVRGFLYTYASLLNLPFEEVRALYEQERGRPALVSIAPISQPPRVRSFVLPGLGVAILFALIVAAVAIWLNFGFLHPTTVPPTATPRPPTPTSILPTATPTARLLLRTPTPTPGLTPTAHAYEGLEAVFQVSAPCWVRVIADGAEKPAFEGTLQPGRTYTFTAQLELRVRMGNAGGVRVILNGQDLGVQGASGQVVDRVWKKE
ncbi:MAG: helix-turn-helix domain-containing protein [Chloroflexia bacterium]